MKTAPKMSFPRTSGKDGPKGKAPTFKGDGVTNRDAKRRQKALERRQRKLEKRQAEVPAT